MAMGEPRHWEEMYCAGDVYSVGGTPIGIVTDTAAMDTTTIYDSSCSGDHYRYDGSSELFTPYTISVDTVSSADYNGTYVRMPAKEGATEVLTQGVVALTLSGVQKIDVGAFVSVSRSGQLNFQCAPGEVIIGIVVGVQTEASTEDEGATFVQVRISPDMVQPDENTRFVGHFDGCDDFLTIADDDDWNFDSGDITIFVDPPGSLFSARAKSPEPEASVSDLMMQDFCDG